MKRQTSLHAGRLAQWSEGRARRGKLYARGRVRTLRAAAGQDAADSKRASMLSEVYCTVHDKEAVWARPCRRPQSKRSSVPLLRSMQVFADIGGREHYRVPDRSTASVRTSSTEDAQNNVTHFADFCKAKGDSLHLISKSTNRQIQSSDVREAAAVLARTWQYTRTSKMIVGCGATSDK